MHELGQSVYEKYLHLPLSSAVSVKLFSKSKIFLKKSKNLKKWTVMLPSHLTHFYKQQKLYTTIKIRNGLGWKLLQLKKNFLMVYNLSLNMLKNNEVFTEHIFIYISCSLIIIKGIIIIVFKLEINFFPHLNMKNKIVTYIRHFSGAYNTLRCKLIAVRVAF